MLGSGRIMSYGCFQSSCRAEQINNKAEGVLPRRSPVFAGAVALLALALPSVARAQARAHVAPVETTVDTLGTGFGSGPRYVAIDSSGNLYVGVPSTGAIVKETLGAGGTYSASTIATYASQTNEGVGVDASGNVYAVFRDSLSDTNIYKFAPSGSTYTATTVPSTIDTMTTVSDMAVDAAGDVYLLTNDPDGSRVFVETNTGGVYSQTNPISNSGVTGYGIAVDVAGNLYITEPDTAIKETPVSPSTYSQTTVASGSGIGSAAGIGVDPLGNVYINGMYVYKETPSGSSGYTEGVAAINQVGPFGVTADANGNVYLANFGDQHVHKESPAPAVNFGTVVTGFVPEKYITFLFDSAGTVSLANVVAEGSPSQSFGLDPITTCNYNGTVHVYQPGDTCQIGATLSSNTPGIRHGAAFIEDGSGNKIATAFLHGVIQEFLVGYDSAKISSLSATGLPSASQLNGITITADGTMYVPDGQSCSIYEYPQGAAPAVLVAGTGTCLTSSGDGSIASSTTGFYNPIATAIDGAGSLYIVDQNLIRKIDGQSGIISTVAGIQSNTAYRPDGGPALGAPLGGLPRALAVDGSGNLYFSVGNTVREIVAGTGLLYTVAGKISLGPGFSGDGGSARNAQFNSVAGMAFDVSGNLFVADQLNNIVRKVATDGTIATVAGVAPAVYSGAAEPSNHGHGADGTVATTAMLDQPTGLAVDPAGNLYIADSNNFLVRRVNTASPGVISTVAGLYNGGGGFGSANSANTGDGGPAPAAGLGHIRDIALDIYANVYIVVDDQHAIRMVTEVQGTVAGFADTVVGTTTAAKDATVLNLGNAPLPFNHILGSADYTVGGADTSCTTSTPVPAGGSCVLGIQFAPTTTGLLQEAVGVSEEGGDGDITESIAVTGTGTNNPPTQTALSTIATPIYTGSNLGTVTVSIEAADASVSTTATNSVTVTITGPASFTPVTMAAVAGVDTFNLSGDVFTVPGTYTITATSSGLTTSTATFVVSLPPAQLALTGVPTTLVAGGNLGAGVMVAVEDVNGAVVASASTAVTLTVTGPFGFSQTFTGTAMNGIATFNLASTPLPEGGVYTLTATGGSLTSSTANVTVSAQTGALTLSVSPGTAAQGAPVTLLATATMGGAPVLHGTVTFNYTQVVNGVTLTGSFGSGQLLTSGPNAGTSTLVVRPGIGSYTVTAVFAGTAATTAATSTSTTLTITGTTPIATISTVAASAPPGNYTLTAEVGVFGLLTAPTGNVSFLNTTASNTSLATAALDPTTFGPAFIPAPSSSAVVGIFPDQVFSADMNGDGIADLVTVEYDASIGNSRMTLRLGLGDGTFQPATSIVANIGLTSAAIGDVNNDGHPDIVASSFYGAVVVLLGDGTGNFAVPPFAPGPYVPLTGGSTGSVFLADLNNDGNLDIVFLNSGSAGVVGTLLGSGDGTYSTAPTTYPTGSYPYGLVVTDLNQDGKLDIAISNNVDGIQTLLGNGDATFQPFVTIPGSVGTNYPAAGSLRGNGTVDLVAPLSNGNGFVVYPGNNDGTFATGTSFPTNYAIQRLKLVDLNHDGKLDVAALSYGSAGNNPTYLAVLNGNGDFTFGTERDVAFGGGEPNGFVFADFNNDGLLDAVAADNTGIVPVLLGVQASTATVTGIAVPGPGPVQNVDASYAGDSTHIASVSTAIPLIPAVTTTVLSASPFSGTSGTTITVTATVSSTVLGAAGAGTVSFYNLVGNVLLATVNVTSGTAAYTTSTLPAGTTNIYAVFSGDSTLAASASINLPVFIGPQTTTTLAVSTNTAVAGTPIVLTATGLTSPGGAPLTHGTVTFSYQQTSGGVTLPGSFGTVQLTSAGTAVLNVAPGAATYVITAVFSGTSAEGPSISAPQTVTVTLPAALASTTTLQSAGTVGDYTLTATVSGFGLLPPSGTVSFLDQTSTTTVTTALLDPASELNGVIDASASPVTAPNVRWIATGDFNNDGIPDIATVTTQGHLVVQLGNGDGSFQAAVTPPTNGGAYTQVLVGDFNNDGKLDIAALDNASSRIDLYLGDGSGTFTALANGSPFQIGTGGNPNSLVTGDFNGDGNLDMAVLAPGDSVFQIFLGAGDGTFISSSISTGGNVSALVAGDFNGDGHTDLAIGDQAGGVSLFLGAGDGTFTAGTGFTIPQAAPIDSMQAGSLRGNGIQDLVIFDSYDYDIYTYLGNNDGTFTATSPDHINTNNGTYQGVLVDMNHDGKLDIVGTDGQELAVYLGNGDGTFGNESDYDSSTINGANNVATADFNHDGLPDFVTSNQTGGNITVLLGIETTVATANHVYALGTGPQMVVASFPGDTTHLASVSTPAITLQPSTQAASTLTVTSSSTAIAFGGSVTLTATVSPRPNSATLGTVAFYLNGALLATRPVAANGTAVLTTTTLPVGSDGITAVYSGDAGLATANTTSTVFNITVSQVTTATTLTSSNLAPVYGQSVTLTATVAPVSTDSPRGTVSFYSGTTLLGTAQPLGASGVVTLSIVLPLGPNPLKAVYTGTVNFAASTSAIVAVSNRATSGVTFTASPTPQLFNNPIHLTAQVSSATAGAPSGTVSFLDGTTAFLTCPVGASGQVACSTTTLSDGPHTLSAMYSGDTSFLTSVSTGTPVAVTVGDLNLALGGDTNKTVIPGAAVTYNFPLSPLVTPTFIYDVTLTATGLPPGATYTFAPSTIPAGSGTLPVALTIQTVIPTSAALRENPALHTGRLAALALGLLLPFAGARRVRARLKALPRSLTLLLFAVLSLSLATGLSGCGSKGFFGDPLSGQSFTITVHATSADLVRTSTVQLNFQ